MMNNYISLDTSVLYRSNQKYFDRLLAKYGIGYAHLVFLIEIFENDGISMNSLAENAFFDKGTVTKSIQKLEELNYVYTLTSKIDRRYKNIYIKEKARNIIYDLYQMRQSRFNYLSQDLSDEEKKTLNELTSKMVLRAKQYEGDLLKRNTIAFYGFKKCSLSDFPTNVVSTLFTGGCNFRCPYCNQRDLIFLNENNQEIDSDNVFEYLNDYQHLIDGICITGGEPLLNEGLIPFLEKIKGLGLLVKLETNGFQSERLAYLINHHLVDYVSMDIKNAKDKYPTTIGLSEIDLTPIECSVDLLMHSDIDYEFKTTVVHGYHDLDDIKQIAMWIKGAKRYIIQNYKDSDKCLKEGLMGFNDQNLLKFKKLALNYIDIVEIKGVI